MVERFLLNLSYRGLPRRASERASERSSIPCQLARSCQKWTRLGADKGNDLGAAKCYVTGAREVPEMKFRIIMPVRTVFSSRQWSRGRERNTTWAQEQTPSNLFTSARPYAGRNHGARGSNPERTERERLSYFRRRDGRRRIFAGGLSSHYADIRSACIR